MLQAGAGRAVQSWGNLGQTVRCGTGVRHGFLDLSVFTEEWVYRRRDVLRNRPQWDLRWEAERSSPPASTLTSLPPQIHSDSDEGDGAIKYTISGEGAGTIFLIDELTGDIHAMERLDREQKTFYTLRAQARDRATDRLLEPESEFIIKVQDINDNPPIFPLGPYHATVPEMSNVGEPPRSHPLEHSHPSFPLCFLSQNPPLSFQPSPV